MRVFARYGLNDIDLGDMTVLPVAGDRVNFEAPGIGSTEPRQAFLVVGRRTFEQRPVSPQIDDELPPILTLLEWCCVLAHRKDG